MLPLLLILLFSAITTFADELRINDVNELLQLSKDVNSGTTYSGSTVYLENDIVFTEELSQQFEPIGKAWNWCYFIGTFDGQGHTVSNLIMNTTLQYSGLFGISVGITLKNIVIDDSCSFDNYYNVTTNDSSNYLGGLIGRCHSNSNICSIENSVNMANITFAGNGGGHISLGGIIGQLYSSTDYVYVGAVINCVNYGTISYLGTNIGKQGSVGGIIGTCYGNYTYNCLNYGTLINNGTSTGGRYTGGIIASTGFANIENCVNVGKIIENKGAVGNIVGYTTSVSLTDIIHCYWTNDTNYNVPYGSNNLRANITDSFEIELNQGNISELNSYAAKNGWNKWILNTESRNAVFKINNKEYVSFSSQLILLPDIIENENKANFSGWYTDSYCTQKFNANEITESTTFYSLYGVLVTVEFDLSFEGSKGFSTMKIVNKTYGDLPEPNRTGYSFVGWFDENNESVTHETIVNVTSDHSLYARWEINNYTISFDFGNGTIIERNFPFNETIDYPKDTEREGYDFYGWDNNITNTPAYNITIHAKWVEVTEYVEIVFTKKEITDEEIKEFIKDFVVDGSNYEIKKVENTDEGLRVIIKFVDEKDSEEFVRKVRSSSKASQTIKRVGFSQKLDTSFSCIINPFQLFLL